MSDCQTKSVDDANAYSSSKTGHWDTAVEKKISSLEDTSFLFGIDRTPAFRSEGSLRWCCEAGMGQDWGSRSVGRPYDEIHYFLLFVLSDETLFQWP